MEVVEAVETKTVSVEIVFQIDRQSSNSMQRKSPTKSISLSLPQLLDTGPHVILLQNIGIGYIHLSMIHTTSHIPPWQDLLGFQTMSPAFTFPE